MSNVITWSARTATGEAKAKEWQQRQEWLRFLDVGHKILPPPPFDNRPKVSHLVNHPSPQPLLWDGEEFDAL